MYFLIVLKLNISDRIRNFIWKLKKGSTLVKGKKFSKQKQEHAITFKTKKQKTTKDIS